MVQTMRQYSIRRYISITYELRVLSDRCDGAVVLHGMSRRCKNVYTSDSSCGGALMQYEAGLFEF